ncbi:hypothetical protein Q8F55_003327 [Vanrija albida]|uniref:ADP-ribosylglycohydrolase n=1 Tax=Vanrija albida TaxID=181172 RepID=A0ABR3Q3M3_9TREE
MLSRSTLTLVAGAVGVLHLAVSLWATIGPGEVARVLLGLELPPDDQTIPDLVTMIGWRDFSLSYMIAGLINERETKALGIVIWCSSMSDFSNRVPAMRGRDLRAGVACLLFVAFKFMLGSCLVAAASPRKLRLSTPLPLYRDCPMSTPSAPDDVPLDPSALLAAARATLHDRAVGVLVGSALGDAVGLYTEFLPKKRIDAEYPTRTFSLLPNPTPFARDMHRLKHAPGEWTDDTDHALLVLLSFLHSGALDPRDLARRLHTWVLMGLRALDTPPLGLGATVGAIVRREGYLAAPVATAHAHWVKSGHQAAANGSLMRTHPLGVLCVYCSQAETFETAARFSAITHVDPRCVVACMLGTALVRGLLRGEVGTVADVDAMVDTAIAEYTDRVLPILRAEGPFSAADPGLDVDEFKRHAHASTLAELELDQGGIGYVLKALGSGLCLLRQALSAVASSPTPLHARATLFEPLITALVLEGGDADTNACFAGALLGAYVGYAALPWRDGLLRGEWLLRKAEAAAVVLGLSGGTYDGKADTDTHLDGGRGFLTPDQRRFMELQARMAAENTAWLAAQEAPPPKKRWGLF